MNLEKILSPYVLLAVNVVIIIAVELTGDLFLRTGAIHLIALLFLALGVSRIFVHYNSFDRFLNPVTFGSIAALILFSISHVYEYASFHAVGDAYSDTLYVDVANLYMTSMLLVALGAQYFLSRKEKKTLLLGLLGLCFLASTVLTFFGFVEAIEISLEPDEMSVYIYAAILIAATAFSINRLLSLGSSVSIIRVFSQYIAISFALIAAAALQYVLYELLEDAGLPVMQIIYISHFFFYAALSLLFLSFPKLARLGGVYESA